MKNDILRMVYGTSNGDQVYMKIDKQTDVREYGPVVLLTMSTPNENIVFPLSEKQITALIDFLTECKVKQ